MMIPAWVPGTFATLMIVVAVVSAAHLAFATRGWRQVVTGSDADGAHLLMAIAMAGMLVSSLRTLPNVIWDVVFGLMTSWFAVRVAREGRGRGARAWLSGCHSPHLVHSTAMLYMFLAVTTAGAADGAAAMAGMGSGGVAMTLRLPTLALVLALALAGYAVRDLDRLTDRVGAGFYHPAPAAATAGVPDAVLVASGAAPPGPAVPAPVDDVTAGFAMAPSRKKNDDRGRSAGQAARRLLTAPQAVTGCRIVMGIAMAYMLVIMI